MDANVNIISQKSEHMVRTYMDANVNIISQKSEHMVRTYMDANVNIISQKVRTHGENVHGCKC